MLSVQVALPATGRVDRTLSVLLRRHMTQAEWDILCDKFDKELKSGRGREALQCLCANESLKRKNLSFHIKDKVFHTSGGGNTVTSFMRHMEIHILPLATNASWSNGMMEQDIQMDSASSASIIQDSSIEQVEEQLESLTNISMPSIQVEIPATGHVDRTLSVFLRGHITQDEWNILCDKFDKELENAWRKGRRAEKSCLCFFLFTVLFVALFCWLVGLQLWLVIFIMFFPICLVAKMSYTQKSIHDCKTENLQRLCEEESSKHCNLSFTVNSFAQCIEIHISPLTTSPTGSQGMLEQEDPMDPASAPDLPLSPMTLEDYEHSRKHDILELV